MVGMVEEDERVTHSRFKRNITASILSTSTLFLVNIQWTCIHMSMCVLYTSHNLDSTLELTTLALMTPNQNRVPDLCVINSDTGPNNCLWSLVGGCKTGLLYPAVGMMINNPRNDQ
jgi:hypothetical protein